MKDFQTQGGDGLGWRLPVPKHTSLTSKTGKMADKMTFTEKLDAELSKYPPQMAWEYLLQLNANPAISVIDEWRDAFPGLVEKLRTRLFEAPNRQKELTEAMKAVAERPTNSYNYEAGATHDDKRRQINLGDER